MTHTTNGSDGEVAQLERPSVSGWPSMAEEKQRPFCTDLVSSDARKNFTPFAKNLRQ